jgi:rubrerythrin
MAKRFDIQELLQVAVVEEQSGVSFYRKFSERTKDPELKELFSWLSEQEEYHRERFQGMAANLELPETGEQYPDEYVDYLEALAAEGGSSEAHRKIDQVGSDVEALDLAIQFERDQLWIQKEMGNLLGSNHQSIIDQIIQEEQNHLVRLSQARRKIGR